jgi:ABC-type hemin transport system ATPase subunit
MMLLDGEVFATGSPVDVLTAENILKIFGMEVLLDKNPTNGKVRVTSVF